MTTTGWVKPSASSDVCSRRFSGGATFIRVVVVGGDQLLFDPQHAVDGLRAEGAVVVEHLAKRVDSLNARLVIQLLQVSFQRLRQLLLHNIPHCWRCFSMRLR